MPYFTSAHITTMLRKALASARQAGLGPSHVKAQLTAKARAPPLRAQVQHYVRQVLHETFPTLSSSISTSSRQATRGYTYALQPIRLGTRTFRPQSPHARLHTAAQAFRSSYALPHAARAGRMTGNVGLGNARGFASGASGPIHSQMLNVPVAFRAFAALLSDEQYEKALPRPSRVHPYLPERHRRKRQCRRASRYSYTSIDSHLSDLSAYFPHIQKRSEVQVALPIVTEELITPGKTSVLSLPLSPSLSSLLDPTPIPYAEAEIGVAVLSTLTSGLLSLQEAFGIHFADRILPLLAHIDGRGLLAVEGTGRVTYEVVLDVQGQPDILKLTFHDRSLQNVRDILAERLIGAGWWSLREIHQVTALSKKERVEMMEDWTQQVSAATVVMPILDLAHHDERENDDHAVDVLFEYPDSSASGFSSPLSAMDQASVSSGFASPISGLDHDDPDADGGYATSMSIVSFISESNATPDHSTSDSIFSSIAPLHSSQDLSWLSPPSEADTDVESAISAELIQELNEVWDVEVERIDGEEAEGYLWTGGNGFGLMQPW